MPPRARCSPERAAGEGLARLALAGQKLDHDGRCPRSRALADRASSSTGPSVPSAKGSDRDHSVLPLPVRSRGPDVPDSPAVRAGRTRGDRRRGGSRQPARRGRARGRAASRAAVPRSGAAPGDDRCAVYCRFCTRSRMVGDGGGAVSLEALAPALAYLRAHPEVRDVIVSGGDPSEHGDRAPRAARRGRSRRRERRDDTPCDARPGTMPQRITRELVRALRPYHPLWVMTHFNHPKGADQGEPRRLRPPGRRRLPRDATRAVLLAGVNDDAATLESLFRGLVRARVRALLPPSGGPRSGDLAPAHPPRSRSRAHGAAPGAAHWDRPPEADLRHAGGAREGPPRADYVAWCEEGAPGRAARTRLRTFRGETVTYLDPPAPPPALVDT